VKKSLSNVTIKNADLGEIEAVFSRFDVVDLDGDVTRKGAFTEGAPVVISAYGHKSWDGYLPIGKGTIHEEGDVAVMKGQFFLNTTHGRDAWETVKELSAAGLQEWSYSLHDVVAEPGTVDGQKVRVLKKIRVKEVSPVLIGAGIDTGTLSTKGAKQLASATRQALTAAARERWGDEDNWVWVEDFDPAEQFAIIQIETSDGARLVQVDYSTVDDSTVTLGDDETDVVRTVAYARKGKFSEHASQVLAAIDVLADRAAEVVALRAEKGKTISTESAGLVRELAARCQRLKALLDDASTDDVDPDVSEPTADDQAANELLRFVALSQGVTSP
jgi:hypothetical protein